METFEQHHTPLNITLELATVETIKRFVQLKIGLAFVPRMCVAEELTADARNRSRSRAELTSERCGSPTDARLRSPMPPGAFLEILHQHASRSPGKQC